jgi:hypothetical protein
MAKMGYRPGRQNRTPGHGKWARRFRDVLAEIISDLGGPDCLSKGQRQLAPGL